MTVDGKEKGLAAVGISVATGCKPCTDFHVNAARKAGASDHEIELPLVPVLLILGGGAMLIGAVRGRHLLKK